VPLFTKQHKLVPAKGGDTLIWEGNLGPGRNKCPSIVWSMTVICRLFALETGDRDRPLRSFRLPMYLHLYQVKLHIYLLIIKLY